MCFSKTEFFNSTKSIALLQRPLAIPLGWPFLQYLFKSNQCVCGDLVLEIGLAQATISQQLKAIKSMGLVQGSIEGNSVCYCIDQKNWIRMKHILSDFLDQDLNPNQCCS